MPTIESQGHDTWSLAKERLETGDVQKQSRPTTHEVQGTGEKSTSILICTLHCWVLLSQVCLCVCVSVYVFCF